MPKTSRSSSHNQCVIWRKAQMKRKWLQLHWKINCHAFFDSHAQTEVCSTHISPNTLHSLSLLLPLAFLFVGEDKYPHNRKALLLMHFQQSTASITCIYLQVRIYFLLGAVRFVFMRKWKGLRHYCAGCILIRCRQSQLLQLFTCKCLNKSASCMDAFTPCNCDLYTCVGLYEKRLLGCCHGDALTIILLQCNLKAFL